MRGELEAAPGGLDRSSAEWVRALGSKGNEAAVARLREHLLRVSRSELNRRRPQLPFGGPELEDVAEQAASDAALAILAKLDQFRGESSFTTWASRFAVLEVVSKVGRHLWRRSGVHLEPEAWERLPDRLGFDPALGSEWGELFAALRRAVEEALSERQRRVFEALVLNEVPLEAVAAELGGSRNAIYKTLFDARRKLREALVADGLLDGR